MEVHNNLRFPASGQPNRSVYEKMMKIILLLMMLLSTPSIVFGIEKADSVFVSKSESKLHLKRDGKTFEKYRVVFGANPNGHKRQEGFVWATRVKALLDESDRSGPKKTGSPPTELWSCDHWHAR